MKHLSAFGSYRLFIALRTHFKTETYDFFKYKGKLGTKEAYEKRNDKLFFEKLAKMYDARELRDYYIANLLDDHWYVTDMLDEEAHGRYYEHTRRLQSLSYTFKQEAAKLFEMDVRSPFALHPGSYPRVIHGWLAGDLSLPSLVILDDFVGFSQKFHKYMTDDILWRKLDLKIRKYRPFLKYDRDKFKLLLKEAINASTANSFGQSV